MFKQVKNVLDSIGLLNPIRALLYNTVRRKTTVTVDGIDMGFITTSEDLHRRAVSVGGEREQLSRFLDFLVPGDVVWDVGSFIGMYSTFASARVGDDGQVVAFEPESSAFDMLNANVANNHLGNVLTLNIALSDANTMDGFVYSSDENKNATHSLRKNSDIHGDGQQVQIVRGDDLHRESDIAIPNAIKMDIEGGEFAALSGMTEVLRNRACRLLFIEVHPEDIQRFGGSVESLDRLLEDVGFDISERIERGAEYHYFCHKTE